MRRGWRRIGLLLVAVALAGLGALVDPRPAYACSCPPISTEEAVEGADAAFKGRVIAVEPTPGRGSGDRVDLRFAVETVFKGTVYAEQVVATARDSAACGLEPELGSSWVIFAVQNVQGNGDRRVTRLTTDLCRGNLSGAVVPSSLGSGRPPVAGASDTEEKATLVDQRVTRGLVVTGVGALVLVVLGGLGLALLWRRR